MRKLTNKMAIIAIITIFFTSFFHFHALSVQADSAAFADLSSNEDIILGQVVVKYKHSVQRSSSYGIQSLGLQTETIHFAESIQVRDKIAQLEKDPNVEFAEPVYKLHLATFNSADGSITRNVYFDQSNSTYMHNWGKTVTKIPYAQGLTSPSLTQQVIVAVVDTGVYMDHPDLNGAKIQGNTGWNFINNNNNPQDDNGHGTNVAGIIAADGGLSGNGYIGVAPGAKILPIKVLDATGAGTSDIVAAGINYAVTQHVNIINLSLGSSGDSILIHQAIQNAVNQGILVVAAAGNNGNNLSGSDAGNLDFDQYNNPIPDKYAANTGYPAAYPEVISVGATEQLLGGSQVIADFSNVGKIDVVAPGVNIFSTYKDPVPPYGRNYIYMSGTSQATPIVAGFAALLKANDRSLDVQSLTSIIKESATPIGGSITYAGGTLNNFQIYGYGLIDGNASIQRPRLNINAAAQFDASNHVTLNVSTKDYKGNPASVNASVYGRLNQINEENVGTSRYTSLSAPIISLAGGTGSIVLTKPIPQASFYHYYIYVNDNSNSTQYIGSKIIEFVNRPSVPIPDKSGSFIGAQQITLTSNANDSIYYSLNGGVTYQHYTNPITISQSSTLFTYALKDHVYSDDGTFSYVINSSSSSTDVTPPTSGGCGACGFVPFIPPGLVGSPTPTPIPTATATPTATPAPKPFDNQITKGVDGKSSLEVKPNKVHLIDLLNKSKDDIIVNAKSIEAVNAVSVDLDGSVMLKAKEKGTPIIIDSNDLQIHFAPDTIDYKDSKANVKFSATVADNQTLPANIQSVSTIYDFNLSIDNVDTHTFNKPIEVHFTIDPSKVHNPNNLGVFYYNDTKQAWEYVGGTVKDNTVTAFLPHFSKYAVLENSKTFADIQKHWAKAEIEEMAAKQIINGMTDTAFEPEKNITRAQFVSLLSKSLKLDNNSDSENFNDIPANAWYKRDVYSAFNANIIKGISEHSFAPENKITREQLATLVVNAYLQSTGKQLSDIVTTQEVKYADEGSVSSWARQNVRIATSLGLMSGVGNGKFNPSGFATRAEAAVVLKKFLNTK